MHTRVARWLEAAALVEPGAAATRAEYDSATALREAIASVCMAIVAGEVPSDHDIGVINRAAAHVTLGAPYVDRLNLKER